MVKKSPKIINWLLTKNHKSDTFFCDAFINCCLSRNAIVNQQPTHYLFVTLPWTANYFLELKETNWVIASSFKNTFLFQEKLQLLNRAHLWFSVASFCNVLLCFLHNPILDFYYFLLATSRLKNTSLFQEKMQLLTRAYLMHCCNDRYRKNIIRYWIGLLFIEILGHFRGSCLLIHKLCPPKIGN